MVANGFNYQRQSPLKRVLSSISGSHLLWQVQPEEDNSFPWHRTVSVVQWGQLQDDSCLFQMAPASTGLVLWRDFFKHLKDHVSWSKQFTLVCSQDRLLQLICPNLYVDILIFNLTLFFDFSWRGQELQGQLTKKQGEQLCIYMYVSMIYNYSSHFWEKAETHVIMSINNQCLSELQTLTSCLPLRDDDPFKSHPRLSWYHAFTRFCYITYWKEIRI